MFKVDIDSVISETVNFVSNLGKRTSAEEIVLHLAGKNLILASTDNGSVDVSSSVQILKSLVSLSNVLDSRAGRTGGIGLPNWFKGTNSAKSAKNQSPEKAIAAKLQEEFGTDKNLAKKMASEYMAALTEGKCSPMSVSDVMQQFG